MEESRNHTSPLTHGAKKMRKGTRSCTECRRRKTRCIYSPGDRECILCKSRGARCIEQGSEDPSFPESKRSSLRKQSTNGRKTKKQTGTPIDQPEKVFEDAETSDLVVSKIDSAPIVSLLLDAKLSKLTTADPAQSSGLAATGKESTYARLPNKSQNLRNPFDHPLGNKSARICSTLRSILPSYDAIMSVLAEKGSWWNSFRQKAYAISEAPSQTIEAFAKRTYTSSNPADIGALALAFARSLNKHRYIFTLVDELVISDINYAATIEGLECLILLAKSYTDCGQPKRSWLVWKKGIAAIQLMGLCIGSNYSPTELRLWCSVYHGDRFSSMLLGLPYGLNDNHYQSAIAASGMSPGFYFVLNCAVISGKIIDRNMAPSKPSYAKAIELDEELESIASSLPKDWWMIPSDLEQSLQPFEYDNLREQLLQQLYFFWVKLYLHLPFLVDSSMGSPHYFSRMACIEAAKQVLRRYRVLRHRNKSGYCLFECQTTDFACFTAAVVLLVGTFHCSAAFLSPNVEQDLELVAATDQILLDEELKSDCKVAAQCRKVLRMLSTEGPDSSDEYREVVIPYFGVVVRKRSRHIQSHSHNVDEPSDPSLPLPPQPYCSAGPEDNSPAVENPWSLNGFSLQYISHRGLDRANPGGFMGGSGVESAPDESYFASAAMEWDPGWSVLTDIDWDLMPGIDEMSPEDLFNV
ncbi:hypothetical protein MKX08_008021 [Trichoderma sp. CBMAI-0020]|nr:hypothetical protein MKX08_008021 [Trichoderma sp. CBMAI-0020]WOD45586.1 hypothetical protein [Trichoderma atroviride]